MKAKLFHLIGAVCVFGLFWTAVAFLHDDATEPARSVEPIAVDSPSVPCRTVPATDFAWDPEMFPGFGEPSLREAAIADRSRRAYRFVWHRRDPGPIVLRLERERTGGAVLYVKTGTPVDENGRSRLLHSRTVQLNEDQVHRFLWALDEGRFWDRRTNRDYQQGFRAICAMEGAESGRYGIEAVSSPREGNLGHAGLMLLLCSGLPIDYAD